MRQGDAEAAFDLLYDMLFIAMRINQSEYSRAIFMHIKLLATSKESDGHYWTVWRDLNSLFNEEYCESQLSPLARATSNDTTGGSIDFANARFRLIPTARECFELDVEQRLTDAKNVRKSWRNVITPEDPDLVTTIGFLGTCIRQLSSPGQFFCYEGKMSDWIHSRAGAATMQFVRSANFLRPFPKSDFQALQSFLRRQLRLAQGWSLGP